MAKRVIIKGKFLGTSNYFKKDEAGNVTSQLVHQINVFDGEDTTKIAGVDGSQLKFGDEVTIPCHLYVNDYGLTFRAINE